MTRFRLLSNACFTTISSTTALALLLASSAPAARAAISRPSLPAQARIVGGHTVTASDPVAKSTVVVMTASQLCSGTIIDRDLVITAAHCVLDDYGLRVVFSTDYQDIDHTVLPDADKYHPRFGTISSPLDSQYDLALVHLSDPLPPGYAPAKLYEGALKKGDLAVLAGYGVTDGDGRLDYGVLRKVTTHILEPALNPTEAVFDQTAGIGACHGDSGGPAFALVNGELRLWGVTSRAFVGPPENDCAGDSVYTDLRAHADWIRQTAAQLRGRALHQAGLSQR